MDLETFRDFCLSLPETSESLPFGENTLVFKVCDKMFALCDIDDFKSVNLKCDPQNAINLREEFPGSVLPGYHMNKKHWNTVMITPEIPRAAMEEWIIDSYKLVISGIPRSKRPSSLNF